jgi:hypothetical protein
MKPDVWGPVAAWFGGFIALSSLLLKVWWDHRRLDRAQAERVVCWTEDGAPMMGQKQDPSQFEQLPYVVHMRNASDAPIFDSEVIVRPLSRAECEEAAKSYHIRTEEAYVPPADERRWASRGRFIDGESTTYAQWAGKVVEPGMHRVASFEPRAVEYLPRNYLWAEVMFRDPAGKRWSRNVRTGRLKRYKRRGHGLLQRLSRVRGRRR